MLIMDNELVLRLLYINMDNMVHGVVMAADRPGEDKILLAPIGHDSVSITLILLLEVVRKLFVPPWLLKVP